MDLVKQSVNGIIWTFIDMFINKGAFFLTTLYLARIIGPEEFGLIGMIALFISIGNTLIESGMSTSLLRTRDLSNEDYSTVFITNILVSVFIYILLFAASPYIAHFYRQPSLSSFLRVYSLGFILYSLRSIHNVKLIRELQFKKITYLSLPGNIFSVIISLYVAKNGYGIWSMAILFLINQIITTILFWVLITWSPSLDFNFMKFKYHFKFGYKLVLSALLNTLFENINNILIGKFYNIQLLGFYDRAYALNNYPASLLSGIVMKVSMPAFAIIKEDRETLKNVYTKTIQIAFLISASSYAVAAYLAEPIIKLILGIEWLNAIPIFQILAISFALYPIHSLNINLLSLYGRSDLFLKLEVIKKITLVILVIIGFKYGIYGLVWCNVINSFLALLINTYYNERLLNYSTINQLLDLLPTILVVGFLLITLILFKLVIFFNNPFYDIFSSLIYSIIIFILIGHYSKLAPFIQLKKLLKQSFIK